MTERERYYFKGEEHRLRGELARAIDCYEKALQIDPEYEDALFRMGCCCLKWGQSAGDCFNWNTARFEKAVSVFQKLISLQEKTGHIPGHCHEFFHNLGEAQYHLAVTSMQGNHDSGGPRALFQKAVENYKRAIELNPGRAESYHWLGNTQFALGLYEEAINSYRQAIELNPGKVSYYFPLASAQDEAGLEKESEMCYNLALKLLIQKV
ncbi:MAG: tetratricopeptide repeat protein [Peptococcaceae bacterium]|nr:tetratricopeptide repeat protein [Peptococcaceae bacterium]